MNEQAGDIRWHRGNLPADAIVDEMRLEEHKGSWALTTQQSAAQNMPSDGYGILTVLWAVGIAGYAYTIQVWQSVFEHDRWTRTKNRDGAWSAWRRTATIDDVTDMGKSVKWHRGDLPADAVVDEMRLDEHKGAWSLTTQQALAQGLPDPAYGMLTVMWVRGIAGYAHAIQVWETTKTGIRWSRTKMSDGPWSEWTLSAAGGSADSWEPVAVGMKNRDLMDELVARKGGTIGTGGRAAFALRLDHGTKAFRDQLGPILKKYGLPATMAVYSEQNEVNAVNHSVPWAEVQSWHHSHGMSYGNHSDDHLDKPGPEGWYDGTIGSLQTLKTQMPRVPIEQYIPHGSLGYERYGGFNIAGTHEQIVGTLAGRMALSTHALIAGYRGSRYRALTGRPMQGMTHWSMESSTPADFRADIDRVIAEGFGTAVMFHPEFIGLSGKMTWAQIEECLAYVAQKRDEGLLLPLTLDGLAVADYRSDYRSDLLPESLSMMLDGASIYGNFVETPGAFFSDTPGSYVRHGASLGRYRDFLGGTRTAEWHITSTGGGTALLAVEESVAIPGWSSQREVSFGPGSSILYLPFGIPLDGPSIRIQFTLLAGDVTIHETHAYAT